MTPIMFADNSNFFISGKTLNSLVATANVELANIVVWLNTNKLSINVEKSKFMIFCSTKRGIIRPDLNVDINNLQLQRVDQTKFLGVIIDTAILLCYLGQRSADHIIIIVK